MSLAQGLGLPNVPSVGDANAFVEKNAAQIAEQIEHYAYFGSLMLDYLNNRQHGMGLVLANLVQNDYGNSRLDLDSLLGRFDDLVDALGVDARQLLERLSPWAENEDWKRDADDVVSLSGNSKLFNACLENRKLPLATHLVNQAKRLLKSLDAAAWEAVFKGEKPEYFRLFKPFLKKAAIKPLPEALTVAYKKTLMGVAQGAFQSLDQETLNLLYQQTDKRKIAPVAKKARDYFLADGQITPDVFVKIFEPMVEHWQLDKCNAEAIQQILLPVVSNSQCLSLILMFKDRVIQIIRKSRVKADDFKQKIRQMVEDEGRDDEGLREFASKIGAIKSKKTGGQRH